MITDSPTWQPFHPERGRLPSQVELPASPAGPRGGQVVVMSAVNHADEAGWGPRAAVRIAREWAASGTRVFLADLDFATPALHTVLGEENEEGVADALLYGASIQRIAHPQGEGFFFGPAGTVVADPDDLLRHPGWDEIIEGFLAAGVTLVLYTSSAVRGGPFEKADHRIILTGAGSTPADVEEQGHGLLLAVLAPGSAPENGGAFEAQGAVSPAAPEDLASAIAVREDRAPEGEGDFDAVPAEGSGSVPARERAKEEPAQAPAGIPDTGARGMMERKQKARKGTARSDAPRKSARPWLMLILLVLVGGVLAAGYLGFVEIPGITPSPDIDSAPVGAAPPVPNLDLAPEPGHRSG